MSIISCGKINRWQQLLRTPASFTRKKNQYLVFGDGKITLGNVATRWLWDANHVTSAYVFPISLLSVRLSVCRSVLLCVLRCICLCLNCGCDGIFTQLISISYCWQITHSLASKQIVAFQRISPCCGINIDNLVRFIGKMSFFIHLFSLYYNQAYDWILDLTRENNSMIKSL